MTWNWAYHGYIHIKRSINSPTYPSYMQLNPQLAVFELFYASDSIIISNHARRRCHETDKQMAKGYPER